MAWFYQTVIRCYSYPEGWLRVYAYHTGAESKGAKTFPCFRRRKEPMRLEEIRHIFNMNVDQLPVSGIAAFFENIQLFKTCWRLVKLFPVNLFPERWKADALTCGHCYTSFENRNHRLLAEFIRCAPQNAIAPRRNPLLLASVILIHCQCQNDTKVQTLLGFLVIAQSTFSPLSLANWSFSSIISVCFSCTKYAPVLIPFPRDSLNHQAKWEHHSRWFQLWLQVQIIVG